MSNNIYDILKKMAGLEAPKAALTESKKAKPDFADLDKDGNKTEPMKKAAKDKSKGAVAEAVAQVEKQLNEKYMGFKKAADKKLKEDDYSVFALDKIGQPVRGPRPQVDPGNTRGPSRVYGVPPEQRSKYMGNLPAGSEIRFIDDPKKGEKWPSSEEEALKRSEVHTTFAPSDGNKRFLQKDPSMLGKLKQAVGLDEDEIDESGLQAYLGKKKYGKQGMQALQKAGREGAGKEKMAQIRARHDKMDEGEYNEDVLSPKQKEFAKLAPPPDKITYADKIAGAKKKTEGNKFSGNLAKARAAGLKQADLDGDGDMEPVREADEPSNFMKGVNRFFKGKPSELDVREKHLAKAAFSNDPATREKEFSRMDKVQSVIDKADKRYMGAPGTPDHDPRLGADLDPKAMMQRSTMKEGWDEMQKYLDKKRGPESKGGSGKKAGSRYGGSAQRDDSEEVDGEGQPAIKKKGRPKGTGGGAKFSFKKPKD